MRLVIFNIVVFFSLTCNAQYSPDYKKAPLNPVPTIYTKAHLNINGPIKTYESDYQTYEFDRHGYVTSRNPEAGEKNYYSYDKNHRLLSIGPESDKSYYTFKTDDKGRVIKMSYKDVFENYHYNDKGLYIRSTDQKDRYLYTYSYDKDGRLIQDNFWLLGKWDSYLTIKYSEEDGYIKVEKNYIKITPRKETPTTLFYRNGFNYEVKKSDNLKFDKYGNPTNGLDLQGNDDGYSKRAYTYYE